MSQQIVIVGAGIAGLTLAIALKKGGAHPIVLSKGELGQSNTALAQGGIAAAIFADDSAAAHEADTLRAGAGHCKSDAVALLSENGAAGIQALLDAGVQFDRDETGDFVRGLEGAHSYPRILHSGGDASGLAISDGLIAHAQELGVDFRPHNFVRDVVLEATASGNKVTGVQLIDEHGHERFLAAEAVVIATGGAGQLYRHTTNPPAATCDGLALALRAGARTADTEFVQFHPTALTPGGTDAQTLLISEAVRGAGATLINHRGERFMLAEHPDAELAPRDVVARAIANQLLAADDAAVFLDARNVKNLVQRFPTITTALAAHGINWREEVVPVTPAAHYFMGGVATDLNGATSVPGLYAIGEAACTGVHGANRLASNSLLEGVVFGLSTASAILRGERGALAAGAEPGLTSVAGTDAALPRESATESVPFSRTALQNLMWQQLGLSRNEVGMLAAAARLRAWELEVGEVFDESIRVADLEDRNLLLCAQEVTRAALARQESLGSHWRSDSPAAEYLPEGVAAGRQSAKSLAA